MEISLVDGGLNQFQNANLMTRLIHLYSDLSSSIWTWAALFLTAAAAAFSGTIKTTVLIFLRRRQGKGRSIIPHPSFQEEDDSCSSSSSSDDSDEEVESEEEEEEDIDSCWQHRDGKSEDRPFWPEIGGAVVKAWDELGLGFRRSGSSGSISLFDLNRGEGEVLRSFLAAAGKGQIPAVSFASPAVVLSAAAGERGGTTAVKVWDARGGWQNPAAEWLPVLRRRVVGIAGGDEGKAYVNDEAGSVTAVDLRGTRSPPVETWYAAAIGNGKEVVVREKEEVSWRNGRGRSLTTRLSFLSFLPLYE